MPFQVYRLQSFGSEFQVTSEKPLCPVLTRCTNLVIVRGSWKHGGPLTGNQLRKNW